METLEQLEKQIELYEKNISSQQESLESLRTELEKLKQEKASKRWKPEIDEYYYYLNSEGIISCVSWNDSYVDNSHYSIGNCFKTEEQVGFAVERLEVIAELSEYASDFKERRANWRFHWDYNSEIMQYTCDYTSKVLMLYFPSEEIAKQAVKSVGEDRVKKYYLGVK